MFESPHSDQWRAATVTPYPAPSKEGAFPFAQNPSNCLESKHSKCFTPMWRAATVTPYPAFGLTGRRPLVCTLRLNF